MEMFDNVAQAKFQQHTFLFVAVFKLTRKREILKRSFGEILATLICASGKD
jgi:hypothetical protein